MHAETQEHRSLIPEDQLAEAMLLVHHGSDCVRLKAWEGGIVTFALAVLVTWSACPVEETKIASSWQIDAHVASCCAGWPA